MANVVSAKDINDLFIDLRNRYRTRRNSSTIAFNIPSVSKGTPCLPSVYDSYTTTNGYVERQSKLGYITKPLSTNANTVPVRGSELTRRFIAAIGQFRDDLRNGYQCSDCVGVCSTTCTGSCYTGCSNACFGGCGDYCYTSCSRGCTTNCASSCHDSCSGGDCNAAACLSGCYGCRKDCGNSWAGCNPSCNPCNDTCKYGCDLTQCKEVCSNSSCSTGCYTGCSNACGTGCGTNACRNGCNYSTCDNSCNTVCSTGCNSICTDRCRNGCGNGCTSTARIGA